MKAFHQRGAGFTATELLVVVLIVGGLAIVLFPGLDYMREKARRSACLNNLKQIGLAGDQYSQDNNGHLPCGGNSVFVNMGIMSNYLGSPNILFCPSSRQKPIASFSDPRGTDATNVSYSYNVSTLNSPAVSLVFKSNSNEVVMWDQGVLGNPGGPNGGVGLSWSPTSNHKSAGGNVLFDDCHVAWATRTPTNMTLGCQNP